MSDPKADPVVTILHGGDRPKGLRTALHAVADNTEIRFGTADNAEGVLPGTDAVFVWESFPAAALRRLWPVADALRWIQTATAGVDQLLFDRLVDSDVIVTNSRGVFERPIAEFVLAAILAFAKDIPRSLRLADQHTWVHRETEQVDNRRVLVVGTGPIGRITARLLTAAGLIVEGAGSTARTNDPDFGVVHASTDLVRVVSAADYVVLAAPLTDRTRHLVDRTVLAAMQPTARLINVGRGELVATTDLVIALRSGTIASAALDVVDVEPLPPEHPLWNLDNVLISPHMSGDAVGWKHRLVDAFIANFSRYVAGERLHNIVDKKLGYVPG